MTATINISAAELGDRDAIAALLADVGLSTMGLFEDAAWILVARAAADPTRADTAERSDDPSRILGVAAVERYGASGLLRSVATAGSARGTGLGRALVARAEARCHEEGVSTLYLLTETAEEFFVRRGYAVVDRSDVPEAVRASTQFVALCPSSATAMVRRLLPA